MLSRSVAQTSETPGDDESYHGWRIDKFDFESPVVSGEYWKFRDLFCVNRFLSFPGVYVYVYKCL